MVWVRQEKDSSLLAVRQDIADKIGLNVLTVSSLFPPTSSKDTTIGDIIDGVENDPENIQSLTEHVEEWCLSKCSKEKCRRILKRFYLVWTITKKDIVSIQRGIIL